MNSVPAPRRAAVLLMLFERDGETYTVLTRRTDLVATHKGQISLPGGMREPSDESLLRTALRETHEELGIDPAQVEVVEQLPDVDTVVSNFTVTPFVARLAAPPEYKPDPDEVAEVLEVQVSVLSRSDVYQEEEWPAPDGTGSVRRCVFRYGEHVIWGATARILREFLDTRSAR
jgi:8-oxo-dGTP pyrophosphatase MutT (NUDIX family)